MGRLKADNRYRSNDLRVPDHCGRMPPLPGRGEPFERRPRAPPTCPDGHDAAPELRPTIAIKCAPPYVVRKASIVYPRT